MTASVAAPSRAVTTPLLAWDPEGLWLALQPLAPQGYAPAGEVDGFPVEIVPVIDSTNSALVTRVRGGDLQPGLLVAEEQTAGRGRLGRTWWSQPGGSLMFSLAWPLLPLQAGRVRPAETDRGDLAPVDWSALSLAVGLAVVEVLDPAGQTLGLKWPNDLWWRGDDRKLGGILIESLAVSAPAACAWTPSGHASPATLRLAIIGIGLNIAAQVPAEGEFRTGYAGLQALDPALDAPSTLHRVVPAVLRALAHYAEHGFDAATRAAFAARDVLAGRDCTAGDHTGRVTGIGIDGSLLMHTAAGEQVINSGEVSVRPC